MELCLGTGLESVESFWVKISGQINIRAADSGICYRSLDQEEVIDKAAFTQLEEPSGPGLHEGL